MSGERKISAQEVEVALERYKDILDLEPGWNGEGTRAPSRAAWDRAVAMAKRIVLALQERGVPLPVPKLVPLGNDSIDIVWRERWQDPERKFEVVVNVPATRPVQFYGEHIGAGAVKGTDLSLSLDAELLELVDWLDRVWSEPAETRLPGVPPALLAARKAGQPTRDFAPKPVKEFGPSGYYWAEPAEGSAKGDVQVVYYHGFRTPGEPGQVEPTPGQIGPGRVLHIGDATPYPANGWRALAWVPQWEAR